MLEFIKEKIALISLAAVILLKLLKSYPLANHVPIGATDFASHIFKINYLVDYGYSQWNSFWYGGFPFLKFYTPLSYFITSSIGEIVGSLNAYYLVLDILFIATTVSFYILLKEYNLNKTQIAAALIIFSLSPAELIFFKSGNLPVLMAFLFSILCWISFKRHFENKETALLPASFLFLAILSHVLIGALLFFVLVVWIFSAYRNKASGKKFISIFVLVGLLSSFWYLEFAENSFFGRYGSISVSEDPISFTQQSIRNRLQTLGISFDVFTLTAVLMFIGLILSLRKFKETEFKHFFIPLLVSGALFLILDYKRIILFISMFASVLIVLNKSKPAKVIILLPLVILTTFSFIGFNLEFMSMPEPPETGDRVIYLPPTGGGYCNECHFFSAFLSEKIGSQNIEGWFHTVETARDLEGKRREYIKNISFPLSSNFEDYNRFAKAGMVNYIVVNENYSEFKDYFDRNVAFTLEKKSNGFYIYNAQPEFRYIEINGKEIEYELSRSDGIINADFICEPGTLTIKETFDNDWRAWLNKREINLKLNEFSFMGAEINEKGECRLEMKYSRSNILHTILSLIGIIIFIAYYALSFSRSRRL